jgi:hypothetical protein
VALTAASAQVVRLAGLDPDRKSSWPPRLNVAADPPTRADLPVNRDTIIDLDVSESE